MGLLERWKVSIFSCSLRSAHRMCVFIPHILCEWSCALRCSDLVAPRNTRMSCQVVPRQSYTRFTSGARKSSSQNCRSLETQAILYVYPPFFSRNFAKKEPQPVFAHPVQHHFSCRQARCATHQPLLLTDLTSKSLILQFGELFDSDCLVCDQTSRAQFNPIDQVTWGQLVWPEGETSVTRFIKKVCCFL